jgi:hypothetical protein
MPGLIREARDMQGIRQSAAPKKESEAKPTEPTGDASQSEGRSSRPGKKS